MQYECLQGMRSFICNMHRILCPHVTITLCEQDRSFRRIRSDVTSVENVLALNTNMAAFFGEIKRLDSIRERINEL